MEEGGVLDMVSTALGDEVLDVGVVHARRRG